MEDLDFEDLESTPVFSFDQVQPLTPPSSPEVDRRKSNRQKQRKVNSAILRKKENSSDPNRPVTISVGDESDFVTSPTAVAPPKPKPKQKRSKPKQSNEAIEKPQSRRGSSAKKTRSKSVDSSWPGDLKAIFDIDGTMNDVVMTKMGMEWSSVAVSVKTSKKRSKKSGASEDGQDHLQFEDILGVKIKRERKGKQSEGEGICLGMMIQTFERRDKGRFKEKLRFFGNPSQDICLTWSRRIDSIIKEFSGRPKKIKVFLQPKAGKAVGRYTWTKEVLPVVSMAGVQEDVTEVTHNETIKHEMAHLDLEEFDCIVAMGGDGTVSEVINGLLSKTQADNRVEMKGSATKPAAPTIPLGIIPIGTTNQLCHTVQGLEDAMTGAIHMLLGHTVPSDICTVYTQDKFITWSVNAHYGFFATVLPYMSKYSLLQGKRVEGAFMKALTKSKFRSYPCEVSYLPASDDANDNPNNGETCYKGCTKCHGESETNQNRIVVDEVKSLSLLDESGNSDTLNDLSRAGDWQTIKSDVCSVSVLATPAMSALAPQGMSKYSHTADGTIDLLVVKNTDKKEFLRYLKRHGNNKNQLNLPFIEAVRCSEVKFHSRSSQSWTHVDHGYNEILDETAAARTRRGSALHRADSIEVIDDLEELDDGSSADEEMDRPRTVIKQSQLAGSRRSSLANQQASRRSSLANHQPGRRPSLANQQPELQGPPKVSAAFCDEEDEPLGYVNHNFEEEATNSSDTKSVTSKSSSSSRLKGMKPKKRSAKQRLSEDAGVVLEVSDNYQPSLVEQERARRMKAERKRAERRRGKDATRTSAGWGVDGVVRAAETKGMHFCVHRGLLRLCGDGIPAHLQHEEVKMGCLGIF